MSETDRVQRTKEVTELEKRAWGYFENEEHHEAIEVFDEVLQIDRTSEGALQGKVASLRKLHRFREAKELLKEAIAQWPESVGILSEQAWIYFEEKRYPEAVNAFDRVLHILPENEDIYLWKIFLLRDLGRYEEAAEVIEQATGLFPRSLRVRNEHGWLYFNRQEYVKALKVFEEILEQDKANEAAAQGKVATLRMQGDFAGATMELTRSLRSFPNNLGLLNEQAWLYLEQEYYVDAKNTFQSILAQTPNDPLAMINLAWARIEHAKGKDLELAAQNCWDALQLDRELYQAYGCLGIIAVKRGHIREAESYFRRSIEINPIKGYYVDLGSIYMEMGRYRDAKEILRKAIKLNPDDPDAHVEYGNLYLQTGKVDKAIREFRWARAIEPNGPLPARALAMALLEAGRPIEAEHVLASAIKVSRPSERWQLHLALSQVFCKLGDDTSNPQIYEDALNEVRKAIRIKPRHGDPYFHAGIIRAKLEEYEAALKAFERCLKEDENYLEAEINVRRLKSLIQRENMRARIGRWESRLLAVFFAVNFYLLWFLRITRPDTITDSILLVMVTLLSGLIVVSMMLPWLTRLKITGLEAELSEISTQEKLASRPKGTIDFSKAAANIRRNPS